MVPNAGWIRASWGLIAATLVAAILARLHGLDTLPGLNGDEAYFGVRALEVLHGHPIALRTGSGLPLNPLYFGLVLGLHAVAAPSLWLLRAAPAIASILAVLAAFWLFQHRGRTFAAVFAILVACSPCHLIYGRIAWDPAVVPLLMVAALAAATQLKPWTTLALFALCLWVHPANVLAVPILIAPFIAAGARVRTYAVPIALLLVAMAIAAAVHGSALPPVLRAALAEHLGSAWARVLSPLSALNFISLCAELALGTTSYRYVLGSIDGLALLAHALLAMLVLLLVGVPGLRRLRASGRRIDLSILLGLCICIAGSYVFVGVDLVNAHTERYGLFLVVPICFVFAACFDALASSEQRAIAVRLSCGLLGIAALASFELYFLRGLRAYDAERAAMFRAGPRDPKQQAFEQLLAARTPGRPIVVLAEDWWIYWPLRYLADGTPDMHVTIAFTAPDYRFPSDFVPRPELGASADVFGVTWADRKLDADFARRASQHIDVRGYEPQPILRIHRLTASPTARPH